MRTLTSLFFVRVALRFLVVRFVDAALVLAFFRVEVATFFVGMLGDLIVKAAMQQRERFFGTPQVPEVGGA